MFIVAALVFETLALTAAFFGFGDVMQMAGGAGLVMVGAALENAGGHRG
jgi:hypothetical protein